MGWCVDTLPKQRVIIGGTLTKFKKGDRVKYSRRFINQFIDSQYKASLCFYRGRIEKVLTNSIRVNMHYLDFGTYADYTFWALKKID